eukprot:403374806
MSSNFHNQNLNGKFSDRKDELQGSMQNTGLGKTNVQGNRAPMSHGVDKSPDSLRNGLMKQGAASVMTNDQSQPSAASSLLNKFKFGQQKQQSSGNQESSGFGNELHQRSDKFENDSNLRSNFSRSEIFPQQNIDNQSPLISISQHKNPFSGIPTKPVSYQRVYEEVKCPDDIINTSTRAGGQKFQQNQNPNLDQFSAGKLPPTAQQKPAQKPQQNQFDANRYHQEKLKAQQYLIEKRRDETWQRAITQLGQLGLSSTLIREKGREYIAETYEPFKSGSVTAIKRGDFKTSKIKNILLEVLGVEVVGNCYQVKMQDIIGDQIEGTFHSDCKEQFSKQIRRGRVLILENIAVFSLNPRSIYLIIKADCIKSVVK